MTGYLSAAMWIAVGGVALWGWWPPFWILVLRRRWDKSNGGQR